MARESGPPKIFSWAPEAVSRYWDYMSTRPDVEDQYFSKHFGAGVATFVEMAVRLEGAEVLDWGCGPGHLVAHLIARGANVRGVDSSEDSVGVCNERFAGCPRWGGAARIEGGVLPHEDETFDVVLSVETIEHVLDDQLSDLLAEVRRVLKPGGTAVFTTPNREDLTTGMNFCPACGIEYHRWQHVRSWSADALAVALETAGFQIRFCSDLAFRNFLPPPPLRWLDVSPRLVASRGLTLLRRLADRVGSREFPHLRSLERRLGSGTSPNLVALARRP